MNVRVDSIMIQVVYSVKVMFNYHENEVLACDPSCAECNGSSSNNCTSCSSGFLNLSTNTCGQCHPLCSACTGSLVSECSGCTGGASLNSTTCECQSG